MSLYKVGKCDYCGEKIKILRPSPFMADAKAMMCEECWNETQKEYENSNGEQIPDFDSNREEYKKIVNEKGLDKIIEDVMIPKREYLIVFKDECLNPVKIEIDQDVNRPNNPTDDEIIKEYVSFNYGYTEFEFWSMDDIQYVRIR